MKTIKINVIALIGLVVALLGLLAWSPFPGSFLSASNRESFAGANLQSVETTKIYPNAKVSSNGLRAEVREIDLNPDSPTVTVCADVPTIADWLPAFSATYNGQSIDVLGWMLIDPDNTAYKVKNRCYMAMLSTGTFASKEIPGTLTFSLDYFQTSIPERLPNDLIVKAKERLRDSGIDFKVEDVLHGQNYIITQKPSSYRQEDALQKVREALTDKVYGPWVFTISVGQK